MNRKLLGTVLILLGTVLLLSGLVMTGRNFRIEEQAGDTAEVVMEQLLEQIQSEDDMAPSGEDPVTGSDTANPGLSLPAAQEQAARRPMPEVMIDGVAYIGYLSIPELELELPVASQINETFLEKGPCRYFGTVYQKNFVIGGHRYRRHFRKLYTLGYGDRVIFTDVDGKTYHYQVEEQEVIEPYQSTYLCSGDWDLSLFTCTTGGAARVVVRCSAVS